MCILILGIIGNSLNILVFLSLKTFRENSCAFYLMAMSFLNLGQLLASLLPRMMNLWFSIDWSSSSPVYCKIRVYCFQVCSLTSITCMCLATIDQYLATCSYPHWRRFAKIQYARLCLMISIVVGLLHGIPTAIFYRQVTSAGTGELVCIVTNPIFQGYYTYGFVIGLLGIVPVFVTVLFGVLAYENVSQLAHGAVSFVRRELDKQLTLMVLVQVVYNFVVIVPYITVYMISLGLNFDRKSFGYAQLQFARNITISSFYVYFAVNRDCRHVGAARN